MCYLNVLHLMHPLLTIMLITKCCCFKTYVSVFSFQLDENKTFGMSSGIHLLEGSFIKLFKC